MSLESQDGYYPVYIYERYKRNPRYTTKVETLLVHWNRGEISQFFWNALPDHQQSYVDEKIALSALTGGFKDKIAKISGADGDGKKPDIKNIIFVRWKKIIERKLAA